ncbi:MAG: hypothetical protein ACRDZ3_11990 [Acidimicrobiia bacterium]
MPDLSRRWGRHTGPLLAVVVLSLLAVAAPVLPVGALDDAGTTDAGTAGSAVATQDGWWNRLQGPQEGEPEGNPLRTVAPPVPAPPTVPADAIAVAVAGGQAAFVAAVGIQVDLPPGGLVSSLQLILEESPGGHINAGAAKVFACAATTPWGPGKNAAWRDRPLSDCELFSTEGVRGDDGTWTFDLTGLGTQWTDPFAPLAQNGVVLGLDAATSPAPMQLSWSDFDTGNVVVEMVASAAPDGTTDPGSQFEIAPDGSFLPPSSAESTAPLTEVPYAAPVTAAGAFLSDPLAFSTGQPAVPGYEPQPAGIDAPATTELVAAPSDAPAPANEPLRVQPVVGFWEEIPAPTILLVPIALGLALLVGLILGPGGRPLPSWPRAGGLSRALARRQSGDSALL